MLFFKYYYSHNGMEVEETEKKDQNKDFSFSRQLETEAILCKEFCEDFEDIQFYITEKTEEHLTFVCVYLGDLKGLQNIDRVADDLVLHLNLDMLIYRRKEITAKSFIRELNIAEDNRFIINTREIVDYHDISCVEGRWSRERRITIAETSKESMLNRCKELVVDTALEQEIERIYQPKIENSFGVPAHYVLNISNDKECDSALEILIESLKVNNRIIRNFCTVIDLSLEDKFSRLNPFELNKLFSMNLGGVVVIKSQFNIVDDDIFSTEHRITQFFADEIMQSASEVTTILCCKHKSQENLFKNYLKDLLIVNINDVAIRNDQAKNYLIKHAQNLDISNISGLLEMVEEDISYKPNDLITIFNKWHKNYVKTIQYPQYANLIENVIEEEKETKKVAYNEINNMVGLSNIKKTITDYINYARLQKACLDAGVAAQNTCRHMCFVGNPGTAKTTIARYVAQVMKEQGLLSKGQLIEVGRSDIVSKYVGGTAPNVQNLFKKAFGNVLFIDEAYSLCDGRDGLYGDEAINAIVQEMENKRDDVVVIFAGYKKEMEQFLDKNSGLKSRIANIVEFPDYTEDELMEIAKFQAQKMDIDISQCGNEIKNLISWGKSQEKNFGNGRFVRNILEKARMRQASRLVQEDKLYGENLKILKPVDFETPIYEKKISMGFC